MAVISACLLRGEKVEKYCTKAENQIDPSFRLSPGGTIFLTVSLIMVVLSGIKPYCEIFSYLCWVRLQSSRL